MNFAQPFKRLRQQIQAKSYLTPAQPHQFWLAQKLFAQHGLHIQLTCSACPEQYDVFQGGKQVAYLRLRHGEFRVDYPDCEGQSIYEAAPAGNGMFEDDERLAFLTKAMRHLLNKLKTVGDEGGQAENGGG